MMKYYFYNIKTKLHTKDGASIVLALLFFAMCAMVGSVVLTAATVNIGRANAGQTAAQMQYTLQSAAGLVCDEIEKCEYIGDNTVTNSGMNLASFYGSEIKNSVDKRIIKLLEELESGSDDVFQEAIIWLLLSVFRSQWKSDGFPTDRPDVDLTVVSSDLAISSDFVIAESDGSFYPVLAHMESSADSPYDFIIELTPYITEGSNLPQELQEMFIRIEVSAAANCYFSDDNYSRLGEETVNLAGDNGIRVEFHFGKPAVLVTSF